MLHVIYINITGYKHYKKYIYIYRQKTTFNLLQSSSPNVSVVGKLIHIFPYLHPFLRKREKTN